MPAHPLLLCPNAWVSDCHLLLLLVIQDLVLHEQSLQVVKVLPNFAGFGGVEDRCAPLVSEGQVLKGHDKVVLRLGVIGTDWELIGTA
jgi:hypothetical protein